MTGLLSKAVLDFSLSAKHEIDAVSELLLLLRTSVFTYSQSLQHPPRTRSRLVVVSADTTAKSMICAFVEDVIKTMQDMSRRWQVHHSFKLRNEHTLNTEILHLDDKMLMVWDLHPALDISSGIPSPERSLGTNASPSPHPRPQPTSYVISFPHPLVTVNCHQSSSKEFLVSDSRGSIFLTDWRSDPEQSEQGSWRHSSVIELVEPHGLSKSLMGISSQWTGFAAWRQDNIDMSVHN